MIPHIKNKGNTVEINSFTVRFSFKSCQLNWIKTPVCNKVIFDMTLAWHGTLAQLSTAWLRRSMFTQANDLRKLSCLPIRVYSCLWTLRQTQSLYKKVVMCEEIMKIWQSTQIKMITGLDMIQRMTHMRMRVMEMFHCLSNTISHSVPG